jgi:hypothetical protein
MFRLLFSKNYIIPTFEQIVSIDLNSVKFVIIISLGIIKC